LTPESTTSTDWRAFSQSVHSLCLPPDRDRRSTDGDLAAGSGRSAFGLKGAYGVLFVGSGFIDMALHLWRSNLPSVHEILRLAPERSLATA
jgi:hypothetical protein